MPDNEIVKELQSASEWFKEHGRNTNTAIVGICDRALDLINQLKAEIERLNEEHNENFNKWKILEERTKQRYAELYEEAKSVVKSEAINEFAERLKEKRCGGTYPYVLVNDIDTLVEELTVNYESSKQRKEDESNG